MKNYELTYIISPELTLEEAEAKAKELENQIQQKEGVIIKSEKPSAKTLSYPVKKFGSGFLTTVEFQAEPDAMTNIKEELQKDDKILRLMVLVKNPARRIKERRQRIKPVVESVVKEVAKETEKTEETIKPELKEEKKATVKKVRAEKSKEKADIEDIDKKLDEILSE